jgi:geranylgeranyl pyrophosphate synthase
MSLAYTRNTLPDATKEILANAEVFLSSGLDATEDKIAEILGADTPFVGEVLRYAAGGRGKRFRPRLTLLSAATAGAGFEEVADLAACVECIHLATLMHDDVLDEAATRRGKPSAARRFGNRLSILGGDYIITRVFKHLCEKVRNWDIMAVYIKAVNRMVAGEFVQMWRQSRLELSEEEYYRIIELKSANFLSASCRVGGLAAGWDGDELRALETYGGNAGMSFQITDDWLDFASQSRTTGKESFSDVKSGKLTLPVIYGLRHSRGREVAATVEAIWEGAEEVEKLSGLLHESGALAQTLATAGVFAQKSKDALLALPACAAREMLAAMADWTWQRSY